MMFVARITLWLLLLSAPLRLVADDVRIISPDSQNAVFDEVEVVVSIAGTRQIESIEVWVDGEVVEVLRTTPYELTIDVGDQNREREFVVVVLFDDGSQAMDRVVTPAIAIDLEVELSLEQLYVTVSSEGLPVLDLDAEEFVVVDNGQRQDLVTFERGNIPMTVTFLVDASDSMSGGYLQGAVEAARGFLSRLSPMDEATMLVFSDRLHQITEPSVELMDSDQALDDLESGGGTALNDYLYSALRILDSRHGRPVVILLSDGVDTLSFLEMDEVLWKVRRTDAVIYRVQVQQSAARGLGYATVWRNMMQQKAEVDGLDQAVVESGGRVQILHAVDELPAALDAILRELRQQYVLGYYPADAGEEPLYRPVEVEVRRPGVEVRTRAGAVH